MAEYIEREAAVKAANEWVSEACMAPVMRVSRLFDKLQKVPAADVATVVRCKDCKYSYADLEGLCCTYGPPIDCIVPGDYGCVYGKRRASDGE